jgi:SAM-dependent methyltransferase
MQILIILGITIVGYLLWKYWALLFGAGYDPTPMHRVYKMLDLADVKKDDIVYDLGSGDGRLVITAARRFGARAFGIEIDPFRYLFSWLLILLSGQRKRVTVRYGNFFAHTISEATVITLFLFQPTNNRLREKLKEELKPGTRVVSYIWTFDDWNIADCLPDDRIFLYVIGEEENQEHPAVEVKEGEER